MLEHIKNEIKWVLQKTFSLDDVVVEEPKKGNADLAIPLFAYAKHYKLSPMAIYQRFLEVIKTIEGIESIEFINGFMNLSLKREPFAKEVLSQIFEQKEAYGSSSIGQGKTVVMDYSSPNIAKSFGVGHLRSTMIGNALYHIYTKCGYQAIGVNHLGDWGTQFGKMIVAYRLWGRKEDIQKNPITEMQKLYLRFHEEAENNPLLEQEARDVFLQLESHDPEITALWQWFKDESMKEFMMMYELLNVHFDSFHGESFYNDKMESVVLELNEKGLLKVDEGATIVDLGDELPPALIKKSDGATLYITRDIAAALYRYRTYHADKLLYIVGNEQILHFKQLKAVTDLMGYDLDIEHVNFGLVLIDGKKMSTRSGKFKRLEDVIENAIEVAKEAIGIKNPHLENKDHVAKAVGVGAIIFNDLKNEKHLDVDFNLENMLRFEGQTGPYLQYSSVRIESLLKDQSIRLNDLDTRYYQEDHYFDIIKQLSMFPTVIQRAQENNAPSVIARYILKLAQDFNSFYGKQRIQVEHEGHKQANLLLVWAIQCVLNEGLRMLGIEALKEM